jgi:hypothetical protein
MSGIQIDPAESDLPPLCLPAGALPASHPDYEHEVETDPPEIEPIEHRLRGEFVRQGPLTLQELQEPSHSALRDAATQTLTETARAEKQYYLPIPDRTTFADAPSYLHDELTTIRFEIVDTQQRRQRWYTEVIPAQLETIFDTVEACFPATPGTDRFEGTEYVGHVMVGPDTDPDDYAETHELSSAFVIREADLDDHDPLNAYGIDLPAPLLVGTYPSHSQYTLVPWTDGLVCMCPYKQTNPSAVMCKHELLATVRLAHDETWLLPIDDGLAVPQRTRRFVSPTIATQ